MRHVLQPLKGATRRSLSGARYAKLVATRGISHEETILCGLNLSGSLIGQELRDEAKLLVRKLLPAARQSLGADHNCTLLLNRNLGVLLQHDPKRTRDDPRLNQHRSLRRRKPGATQATTCWKPRPSCRTWSRGAGGSSVPRIRKRVSHKSGSRACARNSRVGA